MTRKSSRSQEQISFKIEKNIPLERNYQRYPFNQMEVGDSFAVPVSHRAACRTAANYHRMRYGKKFSIRTDNQGNARCWRIE